MSRWSHGIWHYASCILFKGRGLHRPASDSIPANGLPWTVDIEALLRISAVKVYEESDEAWAQAQLAERPQPRRRKRG